MIISDLLARSRTEIWSPLFGHARREAGGPAVDGLVRIVWFFGQFRSLVRPEGRAWLMLRLGPHDSGVWLFAGICYFYKSRLRRKPSWLPVALIHNEVNVSSHIPFSLDDFIFDAASLHHWAQRTIAISLFAEYQWRCQIVRKKIWVQKPILN